MSNLNRPARAVNPHEGDTPGERELMLSALLLAANKSRLQTRTLETVYASLRQKATDCAGAVEWIKQEGLDSLLPKQMGVHK